MIWKLKPHIAYIQIGHRIVTLTVICTLISSCCLLCPEPEGNYKMLIQNNTLDTLVISFGNGKFINNFDVYYNMIYPDTLTNVMEYGFGVKEDQNPIETFGSDWGLHDSCWIYYYDNDLRWIVENHIDTFHYMITPNPNSLRIFWEGPLNNLGDSVNNFFNKQSWKSSIDNKGDCFIQFTITESDYNVNN